MENKKEFSKSVLALVAIVLAAVLLLTGLNFITAPLIAENGSAAAFAPLYAVMPDAAGLTSFTMRPIRQLRAGKHPRERAEHLRRDRRHGLRPAPVHLRGLHQAAH